MAGGQELPTLPTHPVWIWVIAGALSIGLPAAAATGVARWAGAVFHRPWLHVFWSWHGYRLPDPIGYRGTAMVIGSFVLGAGLAAALVI